MSLVNFESDVKHVEQYGIQYSENGAPPTGKLLSCDGMEMFRIENERLAKFWWMPHISSLMDPLVLVPESPIWPD